MKYALVTGASRGLGAGFVEVLLEKGYTVFAACKNIEPDDSINQLKTEKLIIIDIDITDDASIKAAFDRVCQNAEHLDLLVNNAGINHDSPGMHKPFTTELENLSRDELMNMFKVNTVGPIMVTKIFSPLLKDSKVINISSYRASFTHRDEDENYNNYGYAASKVALNMMTRDLAHDLKPSGAAVFAIDPGSVHTVMNKTGKQEPIDAARKIVATVEGESIEHSGQYLTNQGEKHKL